MSAPIVILDTETTGLDPVLDQIWEVAAIRINPDGTIARDQFFVAHDESRIPLMPARFREDRDARYDPKLALSRDAAAHRIEVLTSSGLGSVKPHILGAVPSFDTIRVGAMLAEAGLPEPWHYHLLDIENLVAGFLMGRGTTVLPPLSSDDLSRAVGVEPTKFARHTAMGDCEWTLAQWVAITGGRKIAVGDVLTEEPGPEVLEVIGGALSGSDVYGRGCVDRGSHWFRMDEGDVVWCDWAQIAASGAVRVLRLAGTR